SQQHAAAAAKSTSALAFARRFQRLPPLSQAAPERRQPSLPPAPEADLLWFIAHYAPELEDWERDLFLAVREEAYYFFPIYACQIMNEGWASYWHARLLREADFLPAGLYLSAIKSHADVVCPCPGAAQRTLQVNPYHLGSVMWDGIVARYGLRRAQAICRDED